MKWLTDFFSSFKHDRFGATVDAMKAEGFSDQDIDRVIERMKSQQWEYSQW